jgi:hypothetical protein
MAAVMTVTVEMEMVTLYSDNNITSLQLSHNRQFGQIELSPSVIYQIEFV